MMKTSNYRNIFHTAIFTLTTVLALNATASSIDETRVQADGTLMQTVRISFSPDDLASVAGHVELERRIRHAAREVCGPTQVRVAGGLKHAARNRQCIDTAVQGALGQLAGEQLKVGSR